MNDQTYEYQNAMKCISRSDVCALLGIGLSTLKRWEKDDSKGLPTPMKLGKVVRFNAAEIINFLENQKIK